jgi:hypothetical protein
MRIRFAERQVSNELLEFLRRSECVAERLTDWMLEVKPKQEMLPHAARLEVEGLLRVWSKLHPEGGDDVDFVDDRPRRPQPETSG